MALSGKLIGYVEISKKGEFFLDVNRHNPHDQMVSISPDKIHDCELHDGERGAVGSVITWHYTHEGKKKIAKDLIEAINEENHMIVFKVIEGELVEIYKSFRITFHVEEKGDGRQVATYTLEFEKPDVSTPYPTSFMDYLCNLVKDLDAHSSST